MEIINFNCDYNKDITYPFVRNYMLTDMGEIPSKFEYELSVLKYDYKHKSIKAVSKQAKKLKNKIKDERFLVSFIQNSFNNELDEQGIIDLLEFYKIDASGLISSYAKKYNCEEYKLLTNIIGKKSYTLAPGYIKYNVLSPKNKFKPNKIYTQSEINEFLKDKDVFIGREVYKETEHWIDTYPEEVNIEKLTDNLNDITKNKYYHEIIMLIKEYVKENSDNIKKELDEYLEKLNNFEQLLNKSNKEYIENTQKKLENQLEDLHNF